MVVPCLRRTSKSAIDCCFLAFYSLEKAAEGNLEAHDGGEDDLAGLEATLTLICALCVWPVETSTIIYRKRLPSESEGLMGPVVSVKTKTRKRRREEVLIRTGARIALPTTHGVHGASAVER